MCVFFWPQKERYMSCYFRAEPMRKFTTLKCCPKIIFHIVFALANEFGHCKKSYFVFFFFLVVSLVWKKQQQNKYTVRILHQCDQKPSYSIFWWNILRHFNLFSSLVGSNVSTLPGTIELYCLRWTEQNILTPTIGEYAWNNKKNVIIK